jgi:hypothetical protein
VGRREREDPQDRSHQVCPAAAGLVVRLVLNHPRRVCSRKTKKSGPEWALSPPAGVYSQGGEACNTEPGLGCRSAGKAGSGTVAPTPCGA